MKVILDPHHEPAILDWLARVHGAEFFISPRVVMGFIDDGGVLRGASVIELHNAATGELHVYGRTSNDVAKVVFHVAFRHLGLSRIECRTRRDNLKVKRAAPKWGFRYEATARNFYGPGRINDAMVYSMTPEQCRWINGKDTEAARAA